MTWEGTAWSWLPFAVGIPILPVYGWLGATGSLPGLFHRLVPRPRWPVPALAIATPALTSNVTSNRDGVCGDAQLRGSWRLHAGLWGAAIDGGPGLAAFRGVGLAQIAPVLAGAGLNRGACHLVAERYLAGRERAWEFEGGRHGAGPVGMLAAVTG